MCLAHLLPQAARVQHVGDGRDHDELVAAQPHQLVVLAGALAQRLGAGDDHGIAGLVPELVVHRLETVEVEQQQRDPLAVPMRAAEVLVERALQPAPVAEAGERLGLGLLAQSLGGRDAFEGTGEVGQSRPAPRSRPGGASSPNGCAPSAGPRAPRSSVTRSTECGRPSLSQYPERSRSGGPTATCSITSSAAMTPGNDASASASSSNPSTIRCRRASCDARRPRSRSRPRGGAAPSHDTAFANPRAELSTATCSKNAVRASPRSVFARPRRARRACAPSAPSG
jgi:hypothetical protein